jgi:hypothetical protein
MAAERGQKQRNDADDTERSAEHLRTDDVSFKKISCRGKYVKAVYRFQLPFDGVNPRRQGQILRQPQPKREDGPQVPEERWVGQGIDG